MEEKLLLRAREVVGLTGLSRATVYDLIARGVIPSIRVGRAVRVPMDALKQWVAEHTTGAERKEDGKRGEMS